MTCKPGLICAGQQSLHFMHALTASATAPAECCSSTLRPAAGPCRGGLCGFSTLQSSSTCWSGAGAPAAAPRGCDGLHHGHHHTSDLDIQVCACFDSLFVHPPCRFPSFVRSGVSCIGCSLTGRSKVEGHSTALMAFMCGIADHGEHRYTAGRQLAKRMPPV